MPSYDLYGTDRSTGFMRGMLPEYLAIDLKEYRRVFGEEFGIKELLTVKQIEVQAMTAACIADAPEFLVDQIGKARNFSSFKSVSGELGYIAEALTEIAEQLENNKTEE